MSDIRGKIEDALYGRYGHLDHECVNELARIVAEELTRGLAESRDELATVRKQLAHAARDERYSDLNKALVASHEEISRLRTLLDDAVQERDLHARSAFQNAPVATVAELNARKVPKNLPGMVARPTTADTVAEHLAEARQALDSDTWLADSNAVRALIKAVEALAGGASS